MPLVNASIVPNLSLLIANVSRENSTLFTNTLNAYAKLSTHLSEVQAESLVIISGRGLTGSLHHALNVSPVFDIDFQEFGDLVTKEDLDCDLSLLSDIHQDLDAQLPSSLLSINKLDYGSAVPSILLNASKKKLRVLPIYPASIKLHQLFKDGTTLAHILHQSPRRIALIASANFSHRLSHSLVGYLPKAKGYDKKIINSFETDDFKFLLNFEEAEISEYYEYGLAPLAMMAGALKKFHHKMKLLSYEHPLGQASAVINFEF